PPNPSVSGQQTPSTYGHYTLAVTLLVTHDIGIVAQVADYVGVMYAGKLVEFSDVYRLFKHPRHPYTKGLIESTPSLVSDNENIVQISGSPPDLRHLPSGCVFHPRCPRADNICKSVEPVRTFNEFGDLVVCHLPYAE
ncbi:ABC transporter ATP-binding protein, partial [Alicyclobacillus cellulosilyticus]|uniref:ABC transporter ATP-binding protein n=1 Tax=Alicyclobacillus cellulosilyticus TaxID=1003997 RepID=UPI001664BB02